MNTVKRADIKLAAVREAFERRKKQRTPKFRKLFDAFVETLEKGFWRPGDHVPTEKDFASALGVSGGTMQAFMREITTAGIVVRRRGVGSRISDFDEKKGENWYLRFSTELNGDFLQIVPLHISISEITDTGTWNNFLGVHSPFIRIFRVMRVGDSHLIPTEFFLCGQQFKSLLEFDPKTIGNIHIRTILADQFQLPVARVEETLLFPNLFDLPSDVREWIPDCRAILEVLNYSLRERPLIYQRIFIPSNLCRMSIGQPWLPRE